MNELRAKEIRECVALMRARDTAYVWRVGSKVPINVYEGWRPVCQCHTPADASNICATRNALAASLDVIEAWAELWESYSDPAKEVQDRSAKEHRLRVWCTAVREACK